MYPRVLSLLRWTFESSPVLPGLLLHCMCLTSLLLLFLELALRRIHRTEDVTGRLKRCMSCTPIARRQQQVCSGAAVASARALVLVLVHLPVVPQCVGRWWVGVLGLALQHQQHPQQRHCWHQCSLLQQKQLVLQLPELLLPPPPPPVDSVCCRHRCPPPFSSFVPFVLFLLLYLHPRPSVHGYCCQCLLLQLLHLLHLQVFCLYRSRHRHLFHRRHYLHHLHQATCLCLQKTLVPHLLLLNREQIRQRAGSLNNVIVLFHF